MKHAALKCLALLLVVIVSNIYPHVQQNFFEVRAYHAMTQFKTRVESYRAIYQVQLLDIVGYNAETEDIRRFWLEYVRQRLMLMNHHLFLTQQPNLVDPFRYNHPSYNIYPFGLDTYIIGALHVPAIDLSMPIYIGASFTHLHKGTALLLHSSFPVGGNNSNAVIVGQRNTAYARAFRHINRLDIGDKIYIINFMETLIYTVAEIRIVPHSCTEALAIQFGRDLVTLVTTHGMRGNRRLIIIAERLS